MRIAVIGTGVIGRLRAQTVADHPATELAGVADVNRVSAAEAATAFRTKAFADYRQMIDELRPEAVIVSSPAMLHEEMCLLALDRGCHVLVEKPLSNSVESCRRILARAEEKRLALAVGFNHRFYPAIQYLKSVLREGTIGTIDHVRIYGGHDGLQNFRADWMYKSELSGGGCMMDIGIHMTDLARFVAGEIDTVYGVSSGTIWNVPGSEDNAMAILHTESGVPIVYQATWTEWRGFHWHVDVYGALGMVRAAYAPMFNLLVTHDRPGEKRRKRYKAYPEIILREKLKGWETTTKGTFDGELADFLRMIRGEKSVDLADGWSGVRANEIAQAVYRSTRERAPVSLPSR
jgi:predicted dehydrogenase